MELKLKSINLITAILLLMLRVIVMVYDCDYSLSSWINLSIPILFLATQNIKVFYPAFYTIVAVLMTSLGSYDNFAGAIFFFISAYDKKNKENIIINVIALLISLSVKFYIVGYFGSNIFSFVIAFFFVFSHMYIRFWKTEEKIEIKGLTPEQISTIETMLKGLTHKESAEKLNIERKTYSARVASLRKKFGVKTDFQLAIELQKQGYISLNTLANAEIHQ